MNLALLQLDIVWGNPAENVRCAELLMDESPECDLYVLPEMWATGFTQQPETMAEEENSSIALQWMKAKAVEHHCAICGSLAVRVKDGSYRNRMYFVTPDKLYYYDKHHLFTPGEENFHYQSGKEHTIVTWRGFRFLLLICYDLRFPVWSRYGIAGEYDAIIYTANWPRSRQQAWEILIQSRAIENQCYVVAVNRVGDDVKTSYIGGSAVIDPIGRTIACCTENAEQSLTATLSIDDLVKARSRFNVLSDRDLAVSL